MASCSRPLYLRNWADLQTELLSLVLDKLVLLPDFIRFGAVCKPWRFATLRGQQDRIKNCLEEPPMLLIPVGNKDHHRLYSICEKKFYPQRLQIPYERSFCGSSYGWLAFVENDDMFVSHFNITLLNPFSAGTSICLPPIKKFPDEIDFFYSAVYTRKVILSCDPNLHPRDWIAVAIVGDSLSVAFIRSGEKLWTLLNKFTGATDVLFYQGKLYLLNFMYQLVGIDFSQRQEEDWGSYNTIQIVKMPLYLQNPVFSYLVGLEGDLLLVLVRTTLKQTDDVFGGEKTELVKVHKLGRNPSQASNSRKTREWVWTDMDDLGKFSLFLGGTSLAISASNVSNIKPNCIYYSGAFRDNEGMNMFDLATGEISKYYTRENSRTMKKSMPIVWISPKLAAF